MQILIWSTVILSIIIGFFSSLGVAISRKNIDSIFNSFIYFFLGGLFGGFVGSLIGFAVSYIAYLIIPYQGGFVFDDRMVGMFIAFILCWIIGVIVGSISGIKPIIKLFR